MVTEKQVLDALSRIMDPDLGRDIVSLGFIKNLTIEGGDVAFDVELTTPACPVRDRFKTQSEEAVRAIAGVKSVAVRMTAMARPQRAAKPEEVVNTLDRVDTVIAVSSAKGGVGKSTVAAHLARALVKEGRKVGLLDADLYGPSFPTLFNVHRPDVFMRENRIVPVEVDGLKIMSFGFLLGDSPAVLRGPIVSGYIQQLLTQTDWGDLDYLLIDMPPGTGDIQLTITQIASLDGALIVTTPQALSLVDVAKGILMFEKVEVPVLGLVVNMSWFECPNCTMRHAIFGAGAKSLAQRFGIETLAELPIIPGVSGLDSEAAEAVEEPMRELARNLVAALGRRRIETVRPGVVTEPDAVRVQWPDGRETRVPHVELRALCGCAQCVNEYTGERLLNPDTIPPEIAPENVQHLGNYAMAVAWNDGHGPSIYPWKELEALKSGEKGE